MSEQQDKKESAQLAEVNDELTRSLKLCHSLLDDYRLKLAANLNDHQAANDSDEGESGVGW